MVVFIYINGHGHHEPIEHSDLLISLIGKLLIVLELFADEGNTGTQPLGQVATAVYRAH